MIIRIVKLTFKKENIASFEQLFEETKERIRSFNGCTFLELYQDQDNPAIFITYSYWTTNEDLQAYRGSEFFKSVWSKTKMFFKEKPQAWSLDRIQTLN